MIQALKPYCLYLGALLSLGLLGACGLQGVQTQRTYGIKPSLINADGISPDFAQDPTPSRAAEKGKEAPPLPIRPVPETEPPSFENLPQDQKEQAKKHLSDYAYLREVSFSALEGWRQAPIEARMENFLQTCKILSRREDKEALGYFGIGGGVEHWKPPCLGALHLYKQKADRKAWYAFLERYFRPFEVVDADKKAAAILVTGYYVPTLEGSRRRTERFRYPIYSRPDDLVSIAVATVRSSDLRGRFAGRLTKDKKVVPYYTRQEIDNGALADKKLEIAWVEDPVDLFFLHVQGSGFIHLNNGKTVLVSYAARNGYPYTSVGAILSEKLNKKPASLDGNWIKTWLKAHPQEAQEIMHRNESYIFFTEKNQNEVLGALRTPLIKEQSVAVDFVSLPLGLIGWLDVKDPLDPHKKMIPPVHLQDTGSALVGPAHVDMFMGEDGLAERKAFGMRAVDGHLFVLLPTGSLDACHVCNRLSTPETPEGPEDSPDETPEP